MDTNLRAQAHAEAAIAYEAQLEAELARAHPDHGTIKALNAKIDTGLKLAEVYATLAIADALTGGRPRLLAGGGVDYSDHTPEEVPC